MTNFRIGGFAAPFKATDHFTGEPMPCIYDATGSMVASVRGPWPDRETAQLCAVLAEAPAMLAALRKIAGYVSEKPHGAELDGVSAEQMAAIASAILSRIDGAAAGYCVDGRESDDPDAPYAGDGQFPPFVIFDIQAQDNLPGTYATREAAEAALATICPPTAQPEGAIGEAGGDEPQKPVCRSCGGDSIVIDGAARWNMAGQDWGLSGTYDDTTYCDDCEEETKLNWVAVAPDAAATEGEA